MRVTFHGTLLAVILIVLAMMAIGPARQWYQEQQTIHADEATLAAGNAQASRLNAKLSDLQDPSYVESMAREDLGYVTPGETSYVVSRPQAQAPQLGQLAPVAPSPAGSAATSAHGSLSLVGKLRAALGVMPLP